MNFLKRVFSSSVFDFQSEPKLPAPRVTAVPQQTSSGVPGRGGIGRLAWLGDEGAFLGDFYSYLRRKVPIISNGIAAWVDLATSGVEVHHENGSDLAQRRAVETLEALDIRVHEFNFTGGGGLGALLEMFYLLCFTFGRFAAELVPYADLSGVAYVAIVDPFTIVIRRDRQGRPVLFQRQGDDDLVRLPEGRMFYAPFDPDGKNPHGASMLDSVTWVVEIKEKLLEDMARSSHNAGYPRMWVKIAPPERLVGETPSQYTSRVNTDFDDAVTAFRDLAPDDNVFTPGNVEVSIVGGGQSMDFNWSINLDRVNDEVVSGLRLYPWVLGLSASTTKNWVDSQHDLLMQRVGRTANHGARFMDWIRNTELRLTGSPVRTRQTFTPIRDPGALIQERAETFRFNRVDNMVNRGYVSKDEGARMLGLRGAHEDDE